MPFRSENAQKMMLGWRVLEDVMTSLSEKDAQIAKPGNKK